MAPYQGVKEASLIIKMKDKIAHNLKRIQEQIAAAAGRSGRDPQTVRIIAVTKTVGLEEVRALYDLGIRDFGENRLEVAAPKIAGAPDDIIWHHIAPVQTRKAKDIVALFRVADAIDRVKAAEALQRRCEEQDKTLEILVEVNVTGEESKHGYGPGEVPDALRDIAAFDRLRVTGLMTMAPFDAPEAVLRACFRDLNSLCKAHALPERSMGMTDDFEIAVEEGSTQVRIGRALFI